MHQESLYFPEQQRRDNSQDGRFKHSSKCTLYLKRDAFCEEKACIRFEKETARISRSRHEFLSFTIAGDVQVRRNTRSK